MGVELSPSERKLVERLYDARPERRNAIDESIDELIAARARGDALELAAVLVARGVGSKEEIARLATPGKRSASVPVKKTPSVRRTAPAVVALSPDEQRETAKLDMRGRALETTELDSGALRRRAPAAGGVLGLLVLVALLGGAVAWRFRRAPPPPPPTTDDPVDPPPRIEPRIDPKPVGGEDAKPAPLATTAPLDSSTLESAGEALDLARREAQTFEEHGDYAGALAVYRKLDPALRTKVAPEETRLDALLAYSKEVDAAIDSVEDLRAHALDTSVARERLVKLAEDPRRTTSIGRRIQQKLRELDAPGDLATPAPTAPTPSAPTAAPPSEEKLARARERVARIQERIAAERKEQTDELARQQKRAREQSEKNPLRVQLGAVVLDGAVISGFDASGFTLEAEKPHKTKITLEWARAKPELVWNVRRLAVRDTARDQFLLGRFCVENHLFDEARRAFARVRELDKNLGALLPDLDALERASRVFRGRFTRSGPDAISVKYDFANPNQAQDLDDPGSASIRGGFCELTGSGTFVSSFKEVAFTQQLDVDASISAAQSAQVAVGVHLEPRSARAAEYLVVVRRDTGDVSLYERRAQGTRELDSREGAARGATRIGITVQGAQVRVRVDGKPVLKGTAFEGWGRASVSLGGVARQNGRVVFDGLDVRGKVRAEWLRKSFEEVEALLRGALAGIDDLPVFDRPEGAAPVAKLSLEETLRDASAAAEIQAGQIRLAAGTPLDVASAADNFARALEREPGSVTARYLRAAALEKLGKPRSALAEVQVATRAVRFVEALALEARLLAALGQPKPALEAAEKALALAPDSAEANAARAHACFRGGDLAQALPSLDVALALDPWDDDVRGFRRNVRHVIEGPPWDRRYTKTTEHFEVATDISQEKCDLYAAHLEALRAFYAERFPGAPGDVRGKALIFDTAEGFHRYAELTTDDRVESLLGYYHPRYRQLLLYEDKDDASGEETLRVLYHEGFHQYIHGVVSEMPYWANEGLAEYFSTVHVDKRGKVSGEGGMLPARLADLRGFLRDGGGPVRFGRLMNETPREFYQGPVPQKYAQAWSMVHFLMKSDAKPVLDAYMAELAKGRSGRDAFKATFGKQDLDRLETSWRAHVEKLGAR